MLVFIADQSLKKFSYFCQTRPTVKRKPAFTRKIKKCKKSKIQLEKILIVL